MIVGFTGVIWEARPAQRLALDLHTGPGPRKLAESGLAWGEIAGELADIGIEYGKVIAELGIHWESDTYNHAFEKLTQLVPWFGEAAKHALESAGKTEQQAVATTVALTAMPNPVEIEATKAIGDALAKAEVAAGSPLNAVAANTERAQQDQKQRASRVMESFETATTPVSTPWRLGAPPKIVTDAALAAEVAARRAAAEVHRAATSPAGAGIPGGASGMPMAFGGGGFGGGGSTYRAPKSDYAAVNLAAEAGPVAPVQPITAPAVDSMRTSGMPPMSPAATAANGADEEHRSVARRNDSSGTTSAASPSEINLPAGWMQAGEHDAAVSWQDVADRYDNSPRLPSMPEGEINLAVHPVIGDTGTDDR